MDHLYPTYAEKLACSCQSAISASVKAQTALFAITNAKARCCFKEVFTKIKFPMSSTFQALEPQEVLFSSALDRLRAATCTLAYPLFINPDELVELATVLPPKLN